MIGINGLVLERVSSIHDDSCFDKTCIWHYTASWCEQCLNYCIEMLSKQKKLPRLNPQGRQSSPDQLWKDREGCYSLAPSKFPEQAADTETKVNTRHAQRPPQQQACVSRRGIGPWGKHAFYIWKHTLSPPSAFCFLRISRNYEAKGRFLRVAHSSEPGHICQKVPCKQMKSNSTNTFPSQNSVWNVTWWPELCSFPFLIAPCDITTIVWLRLGLGEALSSKKEKEKKRNRTPVNYFPLRCQNPQELCLIFFISLFFTFEFTSLLCAYTPYLVDI